MNWENLKHMVNGKEFTFQELVKAQKENRIYCVRYNKIAQLNYSVNTGFYGLELMNITNEKVTKRGKVEFITGKELNKRLGYKLVLE